MILPAAEEWLLPSLRPKGAGLRSESGHCRARSSWTSRFREAAARLTKERKAQVGIEPAERTLECNGTEPARDVRHLLERPLPRNDLLTQRFWRVT